MKILHKSVLNHVGDKYGSITIIGTGTPGYEKEGKKFPRAYECRCICGKVFFTPIGRLQSGNTKSCGCLKRTAGGLSHTTEYKVWAEMLRRCTNEEHPRFSDWGGRGVGVSAAWLEFRNFLNDMGKRPSAQHSLDRIDNNLGYCKENCRWATRIEQANNTRATRLLTFNDKTQSMADWARETGLNYNTIRSRVYLLGMSDAEALSTPLLKGAK